METIIVETNNVRCEPSKTENSQQNWIVLPDGENLVNLNKIESVSLLHQLGKNARISLFPPGDGDTIPVFEGDYHTAKTVFNTLVNMLNARRLVVDRVKPCGCGCGCGEYIRADFTICDECAAGEHKVRNETVLSL